MSENTTSMNSRENVFLPLVQTSTFHINNQKWSFKTTDLLFDLFDKNEEGQKLIEQSILESNGHVNRELVDVQGCPVTLAIIPTTQIVHAYTLHLGNELFLIQELVKQNHPMLSSDEFAQFKDHVEEGAGLDPARFPSVISQVTKKHNLVDLSTDEQVQSIGTEVNQVVHQLQEKIGEYKQNPFEKLSDFSLNLTAQYALIRIHLLKFLAILPSLDHDTKGIEVKRILVESLRRLVNDSKRAESSEEKVMSKLFHFG